MSTMQTELVRPPEQLHDAPTSRAWLAIVGAIALLVGFAGGFLVRWATEPTKTTTPVTQGSFGPGQVAHADVTFDGVRAYYNGPTEMRAGTKLVIRLTTTQVGASLAVNRLDPAPTWQQLMTDLSTANSSPAVEPMRYVHPVMSVEAGGEVSGVLARPGIYAVFVGPATPPFGTGSVIAPTMIRVTP